nr:reverse transcriptase domain-containing protein [Tanacetum cinerariifolium]
MDKVRHDKRKEVHARLNFGEGSRERRTREGSHYSSARTMSARPERLKLRNRLRYNDRHVLDKLGHRRKNAFDRLSETYSPSTTKSRPNRTSSTDRSRVEATLTGGTLLIEIVLRVRTASVALGSRMITLTPSTGWGSTTDITIATKTASAIRRGEGIVNPHYSAYQKATPVMEGTGWHSTDECMQLKKQIEELVRAGKISHLTKEIKHGRDQSKVGKKEAPAKDKPTTIYIIQSWQRMTRQKVTQSFKRVKEITFPSLATSSSSTEVLYEHCFNRLRPEVKNQMVPATTSLTGFSGETIWPLGQLRLLVTIGDADHSTRAWMNFMIVRSLSPYNGIIERPGIKEIQAVPSTGHRMLKFLADEGIVTIRSTILIPAECATVITSSKEIPKEAGVRHENFKVALHSNFPDQEVTIEGTLSAKGLDEHRLNIQEGYSPVRQKKRGQAPKRAKAIQAEKGYHQIQLTESDEEKTAFHTGQGVCFYIKMPFGLKNVGATYQRLVDKAFDSQIGRNIEVYVDDLVIKSHTEAKMLRDIGETFRTLRKINMKLNPQKCTFGAVKGMFLGYMITPKGIKSCLDKTKDVLQLPSPRTIKEGPELNHTPMEKLVLSLVFAAKRLQRYFQAHPMVVETDQPIKQIMSRPDVAGRLQKWSVMLEEHNIRYRPTTSVKGQVLADFLAKMPDKSPPDTSVVETQQEPWTLFTDGSSCVDGSGAGLILTSPEGTYALRFQFAASNNEAEYEALIAGLRIAAQMGVKNVYVSVDSKLVANQVLGAYVTKEENMIKYLERVKSLVSGFTNFSINQVPRSKNKKVNALSKIASTSFAHLSKQVLGEILKEKYIHEKEVKTVVEEDGPTWMTPIIEYLKEGTLPSDRKEARKLCIKPLQADYVIREIHEGSCSMHAGPRPGDFVYRSNNASHAVDGGKLGLKWEGPYEVMEALGDGAYKLRSADEKVLPRTWNVTNLKKYYL